MAKVNETVCIPNNHKQINYIYFLAIVFYYKMYILHRKLVHIKVDKVLEQIHAYISNCDIVGFNDYWTYLDRHLFAHLDVGYAPCIRKLNTSILRIYLVLTVQAGRQEKVSEFYEKMIGQLQSQLDWRDWFSRQSI